MSRHLLLVVLTYPTGTVWTQVCAACRHCRLTSQGTPCGVSGGCKLTSVDYHAPELDNPGRVISESPLHEDPQANHCVSQWGQNQMWRVMSDQPGPRRVDGCPTYQWRRACVITSTVLPVGTCKSKSRNSTKRNVMLLASRLSKASARPLAVARAVPNDVSLLHIVHVYLAILTMCHSVIGSDE